MPSLTAGSRLGHYKIVGRLGAGGMGEVYRAEDLKLERPVAIKLLPPGAAGDREAVERLVREAKLASSLQHPGIVTIFAIEEEDGAPYLVMELVEGETLRSRIERGALEPADLVSIGAQVADALDAAHRVGLIHRDIKSSNILVTPENRAKVADFGLAKRLPGLSDSPDAVTAVALTATGAVVGTAAYMSPEQTRGEGLDPRTDIFSLGVVLYEAATGRLPFEGPTALSVLHEIALVEPPAPSRIRAGIPRELDGVILRAMAKEKARRFASAGELAAALRAVGQGDAPPASIVDSAGRAEIAAAAPAVPNNLPMALTSFVGRQTEMEEVARLLGPARLVTLTGAGGCGKSRLSIQIARNLMERYPDGVWLVELAALSDPSLVAQRVASVLGIREEAGKPVLETMKRALEGRTLLIILDNCERLVPACVEVVSALLPAVPGLRVLATSREPLGVPGEVLWRVPPLRVPDPDLRARRDLGRFESVRLFVERASALQPSFALTDENAGPIARICTRLDGIPLAIELAAARIKVLPVPQILRRLEDRFRLLTAGSATALPHQQTLRATVEWSYELLSERERTLFDRLSVFAGGATLEAVESVCADDRLPEGEVLDLLTHLVDRSLVFPEEGVGGSARYRLLETLREYGRERLTEKGAEAELLERHASHALEHAERAKPELMGPEQREWLDRLEEDHDNLRQALDWAASHDPADRGLRLGAALYRFWWMHGHWNEGRTRLEQLLGATTGNRSEIRAEALQGAAVLARRQGAQRVAEELLNESLAVRRTLGNREGVASALQALGSLAHDRGQSEEARALYEESLAIFREVGDRRSEAGILHNLGNVAQAEGRFDTADTYFRAALEINRAIGNVVWEAMALNGLGSVARDRGDLEAARIHHERALALQQDLRDRRGIAYSSGELGSIQCDLGNLSRARELLEENLRLVRDLGDRVWIADSLERFAVLAAAQGGPERALRLNGAAAALRETIGVPRTGSERVMLERAIGPAREALPEASARGEDLEGRRLTLEEAIRYALAD